MTGMKFLPRAVDSTTRHLAMHPLCYPQPELNAICFKHLILIFGPHDRAGGRYTRKKKKFQQSCLTRVRNQIKCASSLRRLLSKRRVRNSQGQTDRQRHRRKNNNRKTKSNLHTRNHDFGLECCRARTRKGGK